MSKTIGLIAAIAAIAVIAMSIPSSAGALPFAKAGMAENNTVLLVREGCGPGSQYSTRLRRCVVDTPRARARDVVRDARCGVGFRFSDRLRRCVRN